MWFCLIWGRTGGWETFPNQPHNIHTFESTICTLWSSQCAGLGLGPGNRVHRCRGLSVSYVTLFWDNKTLSSGLPASLNIHLPSSPPPQPHSQYHHVTLCGILFMSNNKYGFKITNIITAVKLSVAHGYELCFARTYFTAFLEMMLMQMTQYLLNGIQEGRSST